MKKLKKNWKKIIIAIVVVIAISITGILVWIKSWNVHQFPGTNLSIAYPQQSTIVTGIANNLQEQLSNEGSNKNIFISLNKFASDKNSNEIAKALYEHTCEAYPGIGCKTYFAQKEISGKIAYIVETDYPNTYKFGNEIKVFISHDNVIYNLNFSIDKSNKIKYSLLKIVTNTIIETIQIR